MNILGPAERNDRLVLISIETSETSIGGVIIQITHHVFLRRLDRDVDGVRAAEGQVLAHPFLHMSQQLLQKQQRSEVTWKAACKNYYGILCTLSKRASYNPDFNAVLTDL